MIVLRNRICCIAILEPQGKVMDIMIKLWSIWMKDLFIKGKKTLKELFLTKQ